jgi:(4S)-4-hydroxy-5-phosphonooxypentane-2,3-dione isomerase
MTSFGLIVEFEVQSAYVGEFRKLIAVNARRSLADEPGCHRFDVLVDPKDPTKFTLYEIYDDEAAFDAHRKTQHFEAFFAEATSMIVNQRATPLVLIASEGSEPDNP